MSACSRFATTLFLRSFLFNRVTAILLRIMRSGADSNRCIRFCRPPPSHSATRPFIFLLFPVDPGRPLEEAVVLPPPDSGWQRYEILFSQATRRLPFMLGSQGHAGVFRRGSASLVIHLIPRRFRLLSPHSAGFPGVNLRRSFACALFRSK